MRWHIRRVVNAEVHRRSGDTYRFTLIQGPTRLKLVGMEEGMTKPVHVVVKKVSNSTASPTPSLIR